MGARRRTSSGSAFAQALASNGDLVQNALGNLAGSDELISVRGRATSSAPSSASRSCGARPMTASAPRSRNWRSSCAHRGASSRRCSPRATIPRRRDPDAGAGAGDRALPDRETAHPQGTARGARGPGPGDQAPGHPAEIHQHRAGAGAVRRAGTADRRVAPAHAHDCGRSCREPRHERAPLSPGCCSPASRSSSSRYGSPRSGTWNARRLPGTWCCPGLSAGSTRSPPSRCARATTPT